MSTTDVTVATDGSVIGFSTARLVARRMTPADEPWLAAIHSDPEVMQHIGGPRDEPTNRRWVAANVDHWEQHGFGQWTLWSHDGEPVGRGGLRTIHPCVDEDIVEVGYTLARAAWGKGYATEAARAFVEIGFDQYDLPELGAITLLTNESSARVLEKVGFVAERTVTRDIGPHRFWRLQTPGKAAYSS